MRTLNVAPFMAPIGSVRTQRRDQGPQEFPLRIGEIGWIGSVQPFAKHQCFPPSTRENALPPFWIHLIFKQTFSFLLLLLLSLVLPLSIIPSATSHASHHHGSKTPSQSVFASHEIGILASEHKLT